MRGEVVEWGEGWRKHCVFDVIRGQVRAPQGWQLRKGLRKEYLFSYIMFNVLLCPQNIFKVFQWHRAWCVCVCVSVCVLILNLKGE